MSPVDGLTKPQYPPGLARQPRLRPRQMAGSRQAPSQLFALCAPSLRKYQHSTVRYLYVHRRETQGCRYMLLCYRAAELWLLLFKDRVIP